MKYYSIGYCMNEGLPAVTKEDVQKLTHVNLAFGLIKEGLLDMGMLTNIDAISNFRQWNPSLKVVLSVGGWGAGGFSAMAMTEEGRRAFAQSCLAVVEQYHLDGIDIDWEYPCSDAAEIDCDPRDKENYTLLLQTLRDTLGSGRIVSVAVGASESFIRDTEMDKVAQIVDYVQLMTYDLRGGFDCQAGHHAALGASRGDTSKCNARAVVEMFHEAGVPYGQMVIGAAFYSRVFPVKSAANNGLLQSAESGLFGPNYGGLTEAYRAENGYQEFWDDDAEASYLFNGSILLSYESPEAIRRKCRYVMEKGLLGIMYWEHNADPTRELLGVIHETLMEG